MTEIALPRQPVVGYAATDDQRAVGRLRDERVEQDLVRVRDAPRVRRRSSAGASGGSRSTVSVVDGADTLSHHEYGPLWVCAIMNS